MTPRIHPLFLVFGLFAMCGAAPLSHAASNKPGAAKSKPNILFLLSDDHSYPYLGAYGNKDVRTPNLDRLAKEGLRADRAFVTSPSCVPSRASLMSGRSPVAARMVRFTSPLPPDVVTLPDVLRHEAGYFTGVAGRYHHLDGPEKKFAERTPNIWRMIGEHELRSFERRFNYSQEPGEMEDFGGKLTSFLEKVPEGQPWFFWLNFSDPHHVWTLRGPQGLPDASKLDVPPYLPDLPGVRGDLARHIAEIEHLDADIADVLEVLRARGLDENTLVVFMGDNGMAFPHGKGALHDPGLAVPLLVRWPGVVKPGTSTKALISGEDIAPTMIKAAGAKAPKEMSGVSFLPLLRGERAEERRYVFAQRGPHGGDGGMRPDTSAATFDLSRAVRSDRYKLIYNCTPNAPVAPIDSAGQPSWKEITAAHAAGTLEAKFVKAYFTPRPTYELYDLEKDPAEMNNVAGDPTYAEIEEELKLALAEKMTLDWDFLPLPVR
jgi:Arylsulfatase A and related enzymes